MTAAMTLEQVEGLAAQLPPQEQLKLLARISERLSDLTPLGQASDDEAVQRERAARAEAILALCDAAAERFPGQSDAAEDIRLIRDERIEQICRNDA
ncbi:MAG: hypothetical protein ACREEM_01875 [Blastocatellia bacterium]